LQIDNNYYVTSVEEFYYYDTFMLHKNRLVKTYNRYGVFEFERKLQSLDKIGLS